MAYLKRTVHVSFAVFVVSNYVVALSLSLSNIWSLDSVVNSDVPDLAAASTNARDLIYSSADKCGWRLYISGGV